MKGPGMELINPTQAPHGEPLCLLDENLPGSLFQQFVPRRNLHGLMTGCRTWDKRELRRFPLGSKRGRDPLWQESCSSGSWPVVPKRPAEEQAGRGCGAVDLLGCRGDDSPEKRQPQGRPCQKSGCYHLHKCIRLHSTFRLP